MTQEKKSIKNILNIWNNNILYRAWIRLVFPHKLSAFLNDEKVKGYVKEAKENKLINDRMFEKTRYTWKDIDPLGIVLYAAIRSTKPKVIIETGVQSGISSMYILMAMKANSTGVLYSVDLPDRDPKKVGEVVPDELRDNWHLYLGDSKVLLPQIMEEIKSPVDIFFHDSLHTYDHMLFEFEWGLKHLNEKGFIASHDILWNDAFDVFCARHGLNGLKLYNIGLIKR